MYICTSIHSFGERSCRLFVRDPRISEYPANIALFPVILLFTPPVLPPFDRASSPSFQTSPGKETPQVDEAANLEDDEPGVVLHNNNNY